MYSEIFCTWERQDWWKGLSHLLHGTRGAFTCPMVRLQRQCTSTSMANGSAVGDLMALGKSCTSPAWKQEKRWLRICPWWYLTVVGPSPLQRAKLLAIANSPQSDPPACCCMSGHCSRTLFPGKASRPVTCSMKNSVLVCPRESKMFTEPPWQPMSLTVTQWFAETLSICTNPCAGSGKVDSKAREVVA